MNTHASAPQRRQRHAVSPRERSVTIALAVLGVFVTYVPITGVSVSLALIGDALGATTSQLQWVSDSYVLPMAAAVLSAGVFGDLHGRRRVFLTGMVLTVLGGLVAALAALFGAAAVYVLWGGQAISGLGAGLLLPTTLALIAHVVPEPRERGKYIGMWATGIVLGLALGPIVSGLLVTVLPWGWIYAPIVVLGSLAGGIAWARLPESKQSAGRHLDWPGQITASIAIAATIFGVIQGGEHGWGTGLALGALALGGISLIAFVAVELRSTAPLMDLRLFRSAAFTAAALSALTAMFAVVGVMFLLSLFLGQVQSLSPLEIGWRVLFVAGVAVLINPLVGRLMGRIRPMIILIIGLLIAVVGLVAISGIREDIGFLDLIWRLAIFGVSTALMLTAVSVVAINSVDWHYAGMASATSTILRQTGGALGPAILGAVYVGHLRDGGAVAGLQAAALTAAALAALTAVLCLIGLLLGRRTSA